MGGQFSKKTGNNQLPPPQSSSGSHVNPDLSSYEAACQADPELRSFDSTLQDRTSRVINTLAVGVEFHSLSLDSLREVFGSLFDMNQDVVKVILEYKKDIWNNKELSSLVEDYFENSLQIIDLCTALQKCLNRARDSQLIVQVAVRQFEEEQREGTQTYLKTLQQFKNFKASGDPFSEEFSLLFKSVYKQQLSMLDKLQIKKGKLDKKLKSVKAWRKVSNVMFAATFTAVLICSVVTAAITAPPVVTALAAAAAVPLGSMGKWYNSIWNKYENEIKGQTEIVSLMGIGNRIAIADLDGIRLLVERLEIEMEGLLQNADFAIRDETAVAVVLAMDEIKKKLNWFAKTIEDLSDHADKCSRHIRDARTVIIQRIIKHPSNSL